MKQYFYTNGDKVTIFDTLLHFPDIAWRVVLKRSNGLYPWNSIQSNEVLCKDEANGPTTYR